MTVKQVEAMAEAYCPDEKLVVPTSDYAALILLNAKLLSLNAELLEALEWAMKNGHLSYVIRTRTNGEYCDGVDRCLAAIAKARSAS